MRWCYQRSGAQSLDDFENRLGDPDSLVCQYIWYNAAYPVLCFRMLLDTMTAYESQTKSTTSRVLSGIPSATEVLIR